MTTTPDPVSAHDLAEALRDSIHAHRLAFGVFLDREGDESKVDRWQALLDRYDAQQRAYLEWNIRYSDNRRDLWMEEARMRKRAGWEDDAVAYSVRQARGENWQVIRLRRELRALGGEG